MLFSPLLLLLMDPATPSAVPLNYANNSSCLKLLTQYMGWYSSVKTSVIAKLILEIVQGRCHQLPASIYFRLHQHSLFEQRNDNK